MGAAAPPSDTVADEGLVGASEDLPHASARASVAVAAHKRTFRDIDGAPEKFVLMPLRSEGKS